MYISFLTLPYKIILKKLFPIKALNTRKKFNLVVSSIQNIRCHRGRKGVNRQGRVSFAVRGGSDVVIGRVQGPMAGYCFRWWLPIAILSGCFPPSAADAARISCTSTYPTEVARGGDVVVFLGERCDQEINVTEIQDYLAAPDVAGELSISVMPRPREYIATCPSEFVDTALLSIM